MPKPLQEAWRKMRQRARKGKGVDERAATPATTRVPGPHWRQSVCRLVMEEVGVVKPPSKARTKVPCALLQLPQELLDLVYDHLSPLSRLSLKQSSTRFSADATLADIHAQQLDGIDLATFRRYLDRDGYTPLTELEASGAFKGALLACSSCKSLHHFSHFPRGANTEDRWSRLCLASLNKVEICPYTVKTIAEIREWLSEMLHKPDTGGYLYLKSLRDCSKHGLVTPSRSQWADLRSNSTFARALNDWDHRLPPIEEAELELPCCFHHRHSMQTSTGTYSRAHPTLSYRILVGTQGLRIEKWYRMTPFWSGGWIRKHYLKHVLEDSYQEDLCVCPHIRAGERKTTNVLLSAYQEVKSSSVLWFPSERTACGVGGCCASFRWVRGGDRNMVFLHTIWDLGWLERPVSL